MKCALRDLERDVLQETGKRLAEFGFSPRPKGNSFYRKMDGGRVATHLSFIRHAMDFDVTIDVAVRFDSVEDLVHRSSTLLSKKEKLQTFTLGAELGNLEKGEQFRLTVTNTADVPEVVDRIMAKLEAVGLPYIERYSRLENAYDVLSKDDREVWVHSPIHYVRGRLACALLVVMGRSSEVHTLGERKLAFLQAVNDPGAPLFESFLSELISPSE